jgi:hypothetical protein
LSSRPKEYAGSGYDSSIRQLTISASGIDVAATFATAEGILTGVARVVSGSGSRPSAQQPGDAR